MEIIFVKTTTCSKCRQLLPVFGDWCNKNNYKHRVICFDTATPDDQKLVYDKKISTVPSLIFIENGFKRAYSDISNLDSMVSAKNHFIVCKEGLDAS